MIAQTVAGIFFVGFVLTAIGINMISTSYYSVPPIPAGWLIGLLFTDIGGSIVINAAIVFKFFKVQKRFWMVMSVIGTAILAFGIRNLSKYPLELPACPCLPGYYGKTCLKCPDCHPIFSEGCNDGGEGNGECPCLLGWGGETCSVCAPTFTGLNCDLCKRGWDGIECDKCYPGYTGKNCDKCDVGWIEESDEEGILCDKCEPGRWGGFCEPCPVCTTHDSLAVCKDNVYFEENSYNPESCTVTANICTNKYDCSSFNCKGQCVLGDITDGFLCESDADCQTGWSCEYKTCCVEERHGDGTCDCGRNGYWGPFCEPCPGFDGIYSSSICGGHGTCAAAYVGSGADETYSHLRCECQPEGTTPYPKWTGETCGCLKNTEADASCSRCANGAFGPNCDMCPGGQGISQCSRHGKCSDGIDGDGTCDCDVDISYKGLGGWGGSSCSSCHSGDFYGNKCETCPNILMVACNGFLATLPGSGNCITSCLNKDCNSNTGICE